MSTRIDFHTHPTLVREFVEANPDQLHATRHIFNIGNNLMPLSIFLSQMDAAEIDRAVLLPIETGRAAGYSISSNYIVHQICQQSSRFIGFASVDPLEKDAPEQLEQAVTDFQLRGLKLSPASQQFDPLDKSFAYPLYAKAQKLEIPVLFHAGMSWEPAAPLSESHPLKLEQVAIDFPGLNIVIAHMGWPWVSETVALLLKYPNVFADTSCLYFDHPVEFFRYLFAQHLPLTVVERSLRWKLLFGSNYPRVEIKNMVHALQALGLSDACLELIFYRNAQNLLHL